MKIPVELIDHHQLRLDLDCNVEDITFSFTKHGQLSPIVVRKHPTKPDRFEVIFGNRRLTAARKLGWENIDAQVIDASDSDSLILAFSENSDRKDFSDYEKAIVLSKLHDRTGKSYKEIGELFGKSAAFVSQHIAMTHLFPKSIADEEERTKVLRMLSENHARVLARIEDPGERWNTAKLAVKASLSVRELERLCTYPTRVRLNTSNADRNEIIQEIVNSIITGLNSKNLETFFCFASHRDFSMFSRFPPFDRMNAETAKSHLHSLLRQMHDVRMKVVDLTVKFHGDFAFATMRTVPEFKVSGGSIATQTRATIILVKEDGKWCIVHEHWSTADPADITDLLHVQKESRILDSEGLVRVSGSEISNSSFTQTTIA